MNLNDRALVEKLFERILPRLDILESGCHNWTGATSKGHGQIVAGYDGVGRTGKPRLRREKVHRVIFAFYTFKDITDLEVHHTCGNKLCCNVHHMQAYTKSEHSKLTRAESLKRIREVVGE